MKKIMKEAAKITCMLIVYLFIFGSAGAFEIGQIGLLQFLIQFLIGILFIIPTLYLSSEEIDAVLALRERYEKEYEEYDVK